MKRSGTTWQYNVIRVALDHAGLDYVISGSLAEARTHKGRMLLKSHWWREDVQERASLVFTSDRNIDEVYASLERLRGEPPHERERTKILQHYRRWRRVSDYHMPYSRLLSEPETVCSEIIVTLGVDVDPGVVFEEVSAIRPPEKGQDPVTLYFSNHRA